MLQLRYTLGPGVEDQFHVAVVRDKLTRSLQALCPDVLEEVSAAFQEHIPATDGKSTSAKYTINSTPILTFSVL